MFEHPARDAVRAWSFVWIHVDIASSNFYRQQNEKLTDRQALVVAGCVVIRLRKGSEIASKLCSSITIHARDRDLSSHPTWLGGQIQSKPASRPASRRSRYTWTLYPPVTQVHRTVQLITVISGTVGWWQLRYDVCTTDRTTRTTKDDCWFQRRPLVNLWRWIPEAGPRCDQQRNVSFQSNCCCHSYLHYHVQFSVFLL